MKYAAVLSLILLGMTNWSALSLAGSQRQDSADVPIQELVRRIAANESRLRDEYKRYLFKQDVTIQTLAGRNAVTGEFRRVSEIIVNDRGQREERITYFPPPTLTAISVTQLDYQDLAGVLPFALTLEELSKYSVRFAGRERIDELDTYVFDVVPARAPDPKKLSERYFTGRIWVDTVDRVVVRVQGKGVPEDDRNKFPRFESWRENIAKGVWFPTYTYADDILEFPTGPTHVRMVIRYTDYRLFTGSIEIIEDESLPPPTSRRP